jgi:hypothetical protein
MQNQPIGSSLDTSKLAKSRGKKSLQGNIHRQSQVVMADLFNCYMHASTGIQAQIEGQRVHGEKRDTPSIGRPEVAYSEY